MISTTAAPTTEPAPAPAVSITVTFNQTIPINSVGTTESSGVSIGTHPENITGISGTTAIGSPPINNIGNDYLHTVRYYTASDRYHDFYNKNQLTTKLSNSYNNYIFNNLPTEDVDAFNANLNKHLSGSISIHPYIDGVVVGQKIFSSNLPKNF